MPVFFLHASQQNLNKRKRENTASTLSFYYTAQAHLDSGTFRANTPCPISVAHQRDATVKAADACI
jgi:hypothetical protein